MGFFSTFLTYGVVFVVIAALAVAGIFLGKFLREKKNAKDALGIENENK